jgi:para-aminobenzoate synthetase/4-amino-4-deoxychorismate lyase
MWGKSELSGGPEVILESFVAGEGRSWAFSGLVEEITAFTAAEVIPALHRVESCVGNGCHAAGFVSYEAATGLNNNLTTRLQRAFPLLWFGIFRKRLAVPNSLSAAPADDPGYAIADIELSMSPEDYCAAVDRVREYIASGDTYQVNFTLRQRFGFSGNEKSFYRDLCRSQRAPYCAFLDLDSRCILSASPELFFSIRDGMLTTRPMKGTAKRGRWTGEDSEIIQKFRADEKERAENLMIVDLLRNDMGMVSETGSVQVASLFDVETLETVHQMTSTISSRLIPGTGAVDLFRALFPCGSVTGAPKRRTMEIIAELEDSPRNLYTGCIGYFSPGAEAAFSVAIRTIVIDRDREAAEMGLGSGITWDSDPRSEYEECLTKGRFARIKVPEFKLLESILFEEDAGWLLLERHLRRLSRSADYFGFALELSGVRDSLHAHALSLRGSNKVRLLLSRDGSISITSEAIPDASSEMAAVKIAFAETPVDSENMFLYHKTDNRAFYTAALAARPDCADVIFFNERGEVTEGANNNIVARIDGELVTPPIDSGLLPGTFREELLDNGMIRERKIAREELARADEIYLINSVRKWRKAVIT